MGMSTGRMGVLRGWGVPIPSNFGIACSSRMQMVVSHTERRPGGGEK
jgi:hypothetical protein